MTGPGNGRGLRFDGIAFSHGRGGPMYLGFDWEPGRRTVLLGPRGSGKSTLLELGCGALRPERGHVTVGARPAGPSVVGWLPATTAPLPGLTTREQVALAAWMHGIPRPSAWAEALCALGMAGLGAESSTPARHLSLGQARLLGLAELLVAQPSVLLLDEPTVGLDRVERAQLFAVLDALGTDHQIVLASDRVADIDPCFDRVAVLVDGTLRFDGPMPDFLALGAGTADGAGSPAAAYDAVLLWSMGAAHR